MLSICCSCRSPPISLQSGACTTGLHTTGPAGQPVFLMGDGCVLDECYTFGEAACFRSSEGQFLSWTGTSNVHGSAKDNPPFVLASFRPKPTEVYMVQLQQAAAHWLRTEPRTRPREDHKWTC